MFKLIWLILKYFRNKRVYFIKYEEIIIEYIKIKSKNININFEVINNNNVVY